MSTNYIYTIGHSTHSTEEFIGLLKKYNITAVSDVRSSPYSKFNPQFNKDKLKSDLKSAGLKYAFLGKELGARSDDPKCYKNGKVQYDLLSKTELFQSGINRVVKGSQKFTIALMCAEKDPLDCHRTILVARELGLLGCSIVHILSDGGMETHSQSLKRLRSKLKLGNGDLFMDDQEILDRAYQKQGDAIGYEMSEEYDDQQDDEENEHETIYNRIY